MRWGVQDQNVALEVAAGAADLAEGDLEGLGVCDDSSNQHLVNGAIRRHERQSVGQFEPLLTEATGAAEIAAHLEDGTARVNLFGERAVWPVHVESFFEGRSLR